MKRQVVSMLAMILVAGCAVAQFGSGGDRKMKNQPQLRELTGQVLDRADAPQNNAIVYLKNSRTLAVKTFITGKDGKYRFPALSPNVDYDVYAELEGKKSDTKTLSSFDSRAQANINLRIDAAK
jgi:hypothetical protein